MWSLLTSPRGLRLGALTVVASIACVALGLWQFDRLENRRERNALVTANLARPPAPAGILLDPGSRLDPQLEWRTATATGVYDPGRTLLVRNRVLQGTGYHVLVPLRRTDGPALLVARGWIPVGQPVVVPPVPEGPVTVTGRLRAGEALPHPRDLGLDTTPPASVRRVDPAHIAATLPYPAFSSYLEAAEEDRPAPGLIRLPAPETGEGAHLAYGVQWVAFAVLALGGYVVLLRREAADTPGPGEAAAPAEPAVRGVR